MKTRNNLLRVILCLLALTLLLSACKKDPEETTNPSAPTNTLPPVVESGFVVTFEDNPAVSVSSSLEPGQRVEAGTTVTFTLTVSAFYDGTPTVKAGNTTLKANSQGTYSFVVEADTTVKVEGLSLKQSKMSGDGDSDSPYLVTSAVDMLYIAEKVNEGNAAYVNAFYRLENDLDFEGHEMGIIGNGATDAAVFAGYFNGNDKTISNFKIVSEDSQYVGLFGVLQADLTGSGGGAIANLHLKDFTVDASISGNGAFVGAMVGYGMGGSLWLCSAEEGQINVYADSNSFSYVGGLMGIQQAMDYGTYAFHSGISYCHSDVEVNGNSGMIYAAGGIVGYMSQSNANIVAYMNNCYALGGVYGAMHSGGLIGHMTPNTSVTHSYATGTVSAQTIGRDTVNSPQFCYAYAGGIVGCAEANSVISECFATGKLHANAAMGKDYQVTGGILACAEEVDEFDYNYKKATVYNSIYAEGGRNSQVNLLDGSYVKNNMYWNPIDWVFEEGKLPVANLASSDSFTFTVTVRVDSTTFVYDLNAFMPLQYLHHATDDEGNLAGIPTRLPAAEDSTRISSGYYFDEACTLPIPDSYMPNHDMTIYTTVAEYAEVVGDYQVMINGGKSPVILTLGADGLCTYTDAGKTSYCGYFYDGKNIFFEDARFARFVAGELELTHYQTYNFYATVRSDGKLSIIGGVYTDTENYNTKTALVTEENALIAIPLKNALCGDYVYGNAIYSFNGDGTGLYKGADGQKDLTYVRNGENVQVTVDGNDTTISIGALTALDLFCGSWTVDSKANKVYTFDGVGNWSYTYYGYRVSGGKIVLEKKQGTYTLANGQITLTGDMDGTASFNSDGALEITTAGKSATYHRDGGYYGTWVYPDYGMTLKLNGIGKDGQGTARIEYLYDNGTIEAYNLVYALDERYGDRICLYYDGDLFGYMRYVPGSDLMNATIYVGSLGTFMSNVNMGAEDQFKGQWIGVDSNMLTLEFNGFGGYTIGYVTIGEDQVPYRLDDGTLSGSFVYGGTTYYISYDEATGTIKVNDKSYIRKDVYGDLKLVDSDGNTYLFDGRGSLSGKMGTMTVGNKTYTYEASGYNVTIYENGSQVGQINVEDGNFVLTMGQETAVTLRIVSKYTGTWAMSGSPESNLVIGTMSADGKLSGRVNGQDVNFELEEDGALAFKLPGYETMFYFIPVGDDAVVDSNKEWYLYGEQIECARIDEMYGTWKNSLGAAYQFDGMSNSTLVSGLAQAGSFGKEGFVGNTAYGYTYNEKLGQYVLWTTSSTTGETLIYRLKSCAVGTLRSFQNEDGTKAFTVEQGNALYNMELTDEDTDITYSFDGFGGVTTSDGGNYTYALVGTIDYENGIAVADITIGNEIWRATIDFSDSTNPTITLAKQ